MLHKVGEKNGLYNVYLLIMHKHIVGLMLGLWSTYSKGVAGYSDYSFENSFSS